MQVPRLLHQLRHESRAGEDGLVPLQRLAYEARSMTWAGIPVFQTIAVVQARRMGVEMLGTRDLKRRAEELVMSIQSGVRFLQPFANVPAVGSSLAFGKEGALCILTSAIQKADTTLTQLGLLMLTTARKSPEELPKWPLACLTSSRYLLEHPT